MKYIKEKISYIRGLSDGLEISDNTNEGKVLLRILDILGDITDALEGLADAQEDLEEYVETINDDLSDLEEAYVDDLYDDFDIYDEEDFEVECPKCGDVYMTSIEDFEEDAVFCPKCGDQFHLEDELVEKLSHQSECTCGSKE